LVAFGRLRSPPRPPRSVPDRGQTLPVYSAEEQARLIFHSFVCYNIISQCFTGKENEMLQEITIQTTDLEQFKSVLQTALERESKLLEYSIQRTHEALAPFEQRYNMTTDEFERKFNAREIEETLDFLDWWMEVEALRHLEVRRNLIKDARVE
jgi:hypothetical protein